MGRRPYRTTMRPFRDSDQEVTVHWYQVPKSAPRLPYPSAINSLDWRDLQMNPGDVGEVTGADREFDGWGRIVPPIPGEHICGTAEDFALGGRINDPRPPLVRDIDGIPDCCRPPIKGIVIGGAATIVYPAPLPFGGVTLAGTAFRSADPTYYGTGSVDPEEGHLCLSSVPVGQCVEWRSNEFGFDYRLTSTAPRGTSGDWVLRNVLDNVTWTTSGWDGVSPEVVYFTLQSGSWPGPLYVYLGI